MSYSESTENRDNQNDDLFSAKLQLSRWKLQEILEKFQNSEVEDDDVEQDQDEDEDLDGIKDLSAKVSKSRSRKAVAKASKSRSRKAVAKASKSRSKPARKASKSKKAGTTGFQPYVYHYDYNNAPNIGS